MSDRFDFDELARELAEEITGHSPGYYENKLCVQCSDRGPGLAGVGWPCEYVVEVTGKIKGILRRVAEEAQQEGVRSVLTIRCIEHRAVRQYNSKEAAGGECAACEVEPLRAALETEREHSGVLSRANQNLADELARRPK